MSPASGLGTYKTSGKSLVVTLRTPLSSTTSYQLTVRNIRSQSGSRLGDLSYHFSPNALSFDLLPKTEQQAILQQQAQQPYAPSSIVYVGDTDLLTVGLTSTQLAQVAGAIFNYSNLQGKHYKQIIISNVQAVPHDPNSASMSDAVSFDMSVDSVNYTATVRYIGLSSSEFQLFNTDGVQIYDSGVLGS